MASPFALLLRGMQKLKIEESGQRGKLYLFLEPLCPSFCLSFYPRKSPLLWSLFQRRERLQFPSSFQRLPYILPFNQSMQLWELVLSICNVTCGKLQGVSIVSVEISPGQPTGTGSASAGGPTQTTTVSPGAKEDCCWGQVCLLWTSLVSSSLFDDVDASRVAVTAPWIHRI